MAEATADIEAVDAVATVEGDALVTAEPGAECTPQACECAEEGASEDADAQAREAAEAAERALLQAQETAQRKEVAAQEAAERAAAAVETIGAGAGFVTSYGAYYDVKAAKNAADSAAEARARAEALAAARTAGSADADAEAFEADCEDVEAEGTEETYVDEATFRRQVARLTESVARQPLHREIYYKTLVFCEEVRPLREIEEKIATFAEFKGAANSQYHFIEVLEEAGGLERFELDEEGEVVTPDRKEGLTDDEIDDLVWSYAFMTTPAGLAVVEQHAPRARIIELLGLVPERKGAYIELLEFCAEEPRTYNEIRQLFVGRDVLVRLVNGEPQTMQPSVFVDKLEAAGGVEWRDGWVLTDEGRSYLQELRDL